jgi:hypothetical protein
VQRECRDDRDCDSLVNPYLQRLPRFHLKQLLEVRAATVQDLSTLGSKEMVAEGRFELPTKGL